MYISASSNRLIRIVRGVTPNQVVGETIVTGFAVDTVIIADQQVIRHHFIAIAKLQRATVIKLA